MKKILSLISVIALILLGVFLFRKDMPVSPVPDTKLTDVQVNEEKIKEGKIGDMVFEYDNNSFIFSNKETNLNLTTQTPVAIFDDSINRKILNNNAFVNFFLSKNQNPKKLPIEKWFENNNPETEKQSPYLVVKSEKISVGGKDAFKVYFNTSPSMTGGYYDLASIYISNGVDIYEIQSYVLPEIPDKALTKEDLVNFENYKEVVDQIIKSVKFVE